jgi:hypothetical protein
VRGFAIVGLLLLFGFSWSSAVAANTQKEAEVVTLPKPLQDDLIRRGYVSDSVAAYQAFHVITAHSKHKTQGFHPEGKLLLIYRQNQLVLKRMAPEGKHFYRWLQTTTIGSDVTGRGKSNAVVQTWSGGAHCCFTLQVYQLDAKPRLVGIINQGHSDETEVFYFSQQEQPLVESQDWVFAYIYTSFVGTPVPTVLLRFDGQRFALATNLMRWDRTLNATAIWNRNPSLAADIFAVDVEADQKQSVEKVLASWRQQRQEQIETLRQSLSKPVQSPKTEKPQSFGEMIENVNAQLFDGDLGEVQARLVEVLSPLIYGGDPEAAKALLDRLWPESLPGKQRFWREYRLNLQKSIYWNDMLRAYPALKRRGD